MKTKKEIERRLKAVNKVKYKRLDWYQEAKEWAMYRSALAWVLSDKKAKK